MTQAEFVRNNRDHHEKMAKEKDIIYLKNGEKIKRTPFKDKQGYWCVRYNGQYLWVKNWCGVWFQE